MWSPFPEASTFPFQGFSKSSEASSLAIPICSHWRSHPEGDEHHTPPRDQRVQGSSSCWGNRIKSAGRKCSRITPCSHCRGSGINSLECGFRRPGASEGPLLSPTPDTRQTGGLCLPTRRILKGSQSGDAFRLFQETSSIRLLLLGISCPPWAHLLAGRAWEWEVRKH